MSDERCPSAGPGLSVPGGNGNAPRAQEPFWGRGEGQQPLPHLKKTLIYSPSSRRGHGTKSICGCRVLPALKRLLGRYFGTLPGAGAEAALQVPP